MALGYYTLTYTYEAAGVLATSKLEGTLIPSLDEFKQQIGQQIITGGTVWIMGNGTMIGIPASRIVNIELKLEN